MRELSNALLAELYGQNSSDPFITLFEFSHTSWGAPIYLAGNNESITSNSITYDPFPIKVTLPADDGESLRKVVIEADNVSQLLIEELRSVTDSEITVAIRLVLASAPDNIELELNELKIKSIRYNATTIRANVVLDDFLNTELSSEKYTPSLFPGLFA